MSRSRTALGLIGLPGGAFLSTTLARRGIDLLHSGSTRAGDPAAAVAGLAATTAALIAGWLTCCLTLTLAAQLPGAVGAAAGQLRDRVTPALVQRWAAVALGVSVGATITPTTAVATVRTPEAMPATTASGPGFGADAAVDAPSMRVPEHPAPGWLPESDGPATVITHPTAAPGWIPSRPAARHRTDPRLVTGGTRTDHDRPVVTVRRGDSLWSIAADHLESSATDVEIARAWSRWHETNRTVIGDDPHTLLPGMQLSAPPTA